MVTLTSILVSLGIGNARIEISVDGDECPLGGTVEGLVTLDGGLASQTIEQLYLTALELRGEGYSTILKIPLARNLEIAPFQRMQFGFRFKLPHTIMLLRTRTTCRITARAEIKRAVDPRAALPLRIVEHREVTAIKAGMIDIGFREKMSFHLAEPGRGLRRMDYRAIGTLSEWLDGAQLQITSDGAHVLGTLTFYRRDVTVSDRFQSLAGQDKIVCPIQIPCETLLDSRGLPNFKAAANQLRQLLADTMLLPTDARNVLLRPSTSPAVPSECLLRPLGPPTADPSSLLRPSDDARPT